METDHKKANAPTYKDTSWFTNLLLDADDHIYELAASQKDSETISRRNSRRLSALVTFSIMLGIGLALGSVITLVSNIRPEISSQLESLRNQVASLQTQVKNATGVNSGLQAEIDRLRIYVLPNGSKDLQARYLAAATYGGFTQISGRGLQLRFLEQAGAEGADLLMDIDVIATVNGLFEAGADHVAINGVAVTGTTSIRNAGSAVLMNFQPLKRPIKITAIGPENLMNKFNQTDAKVWLDDLTLNYPIAVEMKLKSNVVIQSASIPTIEHAREVN